MAVHFHPAIKTDYPFLAHPPPPRSQQPTEPSFAQTIRRRSSTFSSIAAWAAHVQPGSPATLSPCSPYRRPSLSRGRRPSIASIRVSSASFLHIAPTPTTTYIPTPSVRDFKADLTTVGYTSVFFQLPNTPISATVSFPVNPTSPNAVKNIPIPPIPSPALKPRGLKRFRSLSVLRSRGRSKPVYPDSPTKMKAKVAATSAAIVKRKKAKYATRPPPFVNELALMQFADGGCMDDNVKRVMEAQAKATGIVGLADIYRNGEGGIWLDQDEEWEYTHLLAEGDESRPRATGDSQWVTFGNNASPSAACILDDERRGSVSTQDSDLDLRYVVQPADQLDGDDLAFFGSVAASRKPSMSVLSLPSRPRRTAQHLRKPDFLVEVAFSPLHSPKSSKSPISPGAGVGTMKPKGKARRRPAPLKLSPPSPALKKPTNSPIDPEKARQNFIETSFQPVPVTPTPVSTRPPLVGMGRAANMPRRAINSGLMDFGTKKKPSMLNMMALFRPGKKEYVM